MSVPLWITERAAAFWDAAGGPGPFPRDLGRAVRRALQLALLSLPALTLESLRRWLSAHAISHPLDGPDRPLRACLIVRRGAGFLFVDTNDPEEEQRFSLAHEAAHYLRHYQQPRLRAKAVLGPNVLEVFDGERPPSPAERLQGLLRNVPVGFHTHLMRREPGGGTDPRVRAAEAEADRLAFELLAPAGAVRAAFPTEPFPLLSAVTEHLCRVYGFPAPEAGAYARLLSPPPGGDVLIERLRSAKKVSNFSPPHGK